MVSSTDNVARSVEKGSVLELRGVGKIFETDAGETVHALEGIDLQLRQGEFVSLIGPTGCGKTTLLNIIAGLEDADAGDVALNGGEADATAPCVFQHYTLFPWRSLLRNVTFGPEMRGVGRHERDAAARELLDQVGLSGFEHARPYELSGGMRQRAAIAQALAVRAPLVLMDEPFGALDDATRSELQNLILRLWRERRMAVLFVTHNIDEAIILADRVMVLSGRPGRVIRTFDVDLPRPRDRMSPGFTSLFMQVREAVSRMGE